MVPEILKDEKIRVILDKMRATCSVRERCTSEVREKISKLLTEDVLSAIAGSDKKTDPATDNSGSDRKSIERIRQDIISEIIESLTEDGFLSDSRYAAAFARDKVHLLGWGPQKIRYALLSKKLDEATVNEALALVDDSASANQLQRLLLRKLESLNKKKADKAVKREKLIRFALGRGYTLDSTLSALSKLPL